MTSTHPSICDVVTLTQCDRARGDLDRHGVHSFTAYVAREPDSWDTRLEVEQAPAGLRLLVDDKLYGAGPDWLDQSSRRSWWSDTGRDIPDLKAAEYRFTVEAKHLLGLPG